MTITPEDAKPGGPQHERVGAIPSAIARELARTNSYGGEGDSYGDAHEAMALELHEWVVEGLQGLLHDDTTIAVVTYLVATAMLLQHEADTGKRPAVQ